MIKFFRFIWQSSRLSTSIMLLLGAASGIASTALVAMIAQLLHRAESLNTAELISKAFLFLVLAVLIFGLDHVARWFLFRESSRCSVNLRASMIRQVLARPLKEVESAGEARYQAAYTQDIHTLGFAYGQLPSFVISVFIVAGCLLYLCWLSWKIFLLLLLLAVPAVFTTLLVHRKALAHWQSTMELRDQQAQQFKSVLSGIKEFQLSYQRRARLLRDEVGPTGQEFSERYTRAMTLFGLIHGWTQLVFLLGLLAIFMVVLVRFGQPQLVAPYLIIALFMRGHLVQIMSTLPEWSQAGVVIERLNAMGFDTSQTKVSSLAEDEAELPGQANSQLYAAPSADRSMELRLDALQYSYRSEADDQVFTVGPLSLQLNGPGIVFVVGHNGAGKTTFAKLLCGLYLPESGSIFLNGSPVSEVTRTLYREQFSAIFTVPHVFDSLGTTAGQGALLPENLARAQSYLEKLQLHHKVRIENGKLTTVDLSHGQRKRLALLSAYLDDRQVYLFDEWAENQDPAFKEVFYRELLPELRSRGKLVIVISHESQFYSLADRVLTLSASGCKSEIQDDPVE